MHRVFALDVLACPHCGGRLRVIATVQDPLAVQAILAVISQKLSPRGFSRPFHHPEGQRSFSVYGIRRPLIKTFSC
jgi:uncharacterized protein YbaR (Trm112 family)